MLEVDWLDEINNIAYCSIIQLDSLLYAWALLPKKEVALTVESDVPLRSPAPVSLGHAKWVYERDGWVGVCTHSSSRLVTGGKKVQLWNGVIDWSFLLLLFSLSLSLSLSPYESGGWARHSLLQ